MTNKFQYGAVLKLTNNDTIEDIRKNFASMKECGFNTVVIWPAAFWWEEKGEDYPFHTGKLLLKIAEEYGIDIVMELAGQISCYEYAPDYMCKDEYYPVDRDGNREYGQNSFGFLNYFHPEVKKLICEHFRKVAEAYKDYPALIAYDIFNETMFRSFDQYTVAEFRKWLKNKYGTIEKLNRIWGRTYGDWEQVQIEKWKWISIMPCADYAMFRKDAIGIFMSEWKQAICDVDSTHIIMADNIHSMVSPECVYSRPQDDYSLSDICDEIGMSFYPKRNSGCIEPALRWEIFDAFYDASRRKGFWIAEMQTHIQALFNPNTCVTTNELKFWCMESYSAGAKALIYWMWKPFTTGLQTLGRGIVNYEGLPTERYYLAQEMSKLFYEIGVIKPVKSEIGLLFDSLCEDIQRSYTEAYHQNENLYLLSLFGAYKAMLKNHVRCDIVSIDEIEKYRVIVLSNHLVVGEKTAQALQNYTQRGGILIIDGRFGVVDETATLNKTLPGGKANTITGQKFFDIDNGDSRFTYSEVEIKGALGREIMNLTDGSAVSCFSDGKVAVTERETGKGSVLFFNTSVWFGYAKEENSAVEALANTLAEKYTIKQVKTELGVRVRISENEENYYVFVFNDSGCEQNGEIHIRPDKQWLTVTVSVLSGDFQVVSVKKSVANL